MPLFSRGCILSIALLIVGCGSGNSNSSALTQAQAQTIAAAVSNGMGQALAGTFGTPSGERGTDAIDPVESAANARTPPVCMPSSAGQTCTWPISGTFSCPGGGTMAGFRRHHRFAEYHRLGIGSGTDGGGSRGLFRERNDPQRGTAAECRGAVERLERAARVAGDRLEKPAPFLMDRSPLGRVS